MENLNLVELTSTEASNINGGLILANVGKLIEYVDKGLRAAGVYEFVEGVYTGIKEC